MQIDDASGEIEDELITSTITTNLIGPIRLTSALIEHLKRQETAYVLLVSPVLGFTPMAMTSVYLYKGRALSFYAMSLRFSLRHTSVRVLEDSAVGENRIAE